MLVVNEQKSLVVLDPCCCFAAAMIDPLLLLLPLVLLLIDPLLLLLLSPIRNSELENDDELIDRSIDRDEESINRSFHCRQQSENNYRLLIQLFSSIADAPAVAVDQSTTVVAAFQIQNTKIMTN